MLIGGITQQKVREIFKLATEKPRGGRHGRDNCGD
jgi:hypothetical protein